MNYDQHIVLCIADTSGKERTIELKGSKAGYRELNSNTLVFYADQRTIIVPVDRLISADMTL